MRMAVNKMHIAKQHNKSIPCAYPSGFVRGGPTLTAFFFYLVEEGREDTITTTCISGPLSACQRNAIRWSADDRPT